MRHAKSSWDDDSLTDHQRTLNKRGRGDAKKMALELEKRNLVPELIISSDSERTTQTYEIMLKTFSSDAPRVIKRSEFYGGRMHDISEALEEVEDHISCVLVLGHNPGWEQSVSYFTNDSVSMTTANIAVLSTESENWIEATAMGAFDLLVLLRPKEL